MAKRSKSISSDAWDSPSDETEFCSDDEGTKTNHRSSVKSRRRLPVSYTKGAIMSRQNRMKKKQYLQSLEEEVTELRKNNKALRAELKENARRRSSLEKEVAYLKSVIANNTGIEVLLRSINAGMFSVRKDLQPNAIAEVDESLLAEEADRRSPREDPQVGICLHVTNSKVSLECCSTCNANTLETPPLEFYD